MNESVIDLMVALTYPKRVRRRARRRRLARRSASPPARLVRSVPVRGIRGASHELLLALRLRLSGATTACAARGTTGRLATAITATATPTTPITRVAAGSTSASIRRSSAAAVTPQPEGRVVNGHGYTQIRDRATRAVAAHQQQRQRRRLGRQRRRRVVRRLLERVVELRIVGRRIGRRRFGRARRRAEGRRPVNHRWHFRAKAGNLPRPEGITALRPLIFLEEISHEHRSVTHRQ